MALSQQTLQEPDSPLSGGELSDVRNGESPGDDSGESSENPEMKLTSVVPWFGGKRTMARAIAVQLGEHSQFFEPFCGSLAVVLQKRRAPQETVNDLHGDITNLAWVLQDRALAEELYDRAVRTLFAEAMIRQIWVDLAKSDVGPRIDPDRAYKFLVYSWAMRNGIAGTRRIRGNGFSICNRFTAGGGSPTTRFKSAVQSIPAWHERLRDIVILRRDAFALLPKFDDTPKLAIYADPPYMASTRSGFAAAGVSSRYEHEFDHDNPMFGDQHEQLRDELARFKSARVVVSYYDCPRLRKLYAGWNFVDCTRHKHLHVQNGRGLGRREAPEVLILNGPSYSS